MGVAILLVCHKNTRENGGILKTPGGPAIGGILVVFLPASVLLSHIETVTVEFATQWKETIMGSITPSCICHSKTSMRPV